VQVAGAVGARLEGIARDAVGVDVARAVGGDRGQRRDPRLDLDAAAAPPVMVEAHLQSAVLHLGPDVVDDLLAGADAHTLRALADVQAHVHGVLAGDAGEGADAAVLGRAGAVVFDAAAGYEDDGGESGEQEEAHGGQPKAVRAPGR